MSSIKSQLKDYFFEALEFFRRKEGLSYKDLAKCAGINSQYLSDLRRGKRNPKEDTQEKIAQVFNLSLTDFLEVGRSILEEVSPPSQPKPLDKDEKIEMLEKISRLTDELLNLTAKLAQKDDILAQRAERIERLETQLVSLENSMASKMKEGAAGSPIAAGGVTARVVGTGEDKN